MSIRYLYYTSPRRPQRLPHSGGSSASCCTFVGIRLPSPHASRYFMLYLDQSATDSSSVPKVSAAGSAGLGSDGGALYFPRAKSMREKLHPGNMAAQSLPSWPALCACVYVRCSSGSKENTLFKGSLQRNGLFFDRESYVASNDNDRIARRRVVENRRDGRDSSLIFSVSFAERDTYYG